MPYPSSGSSINKTINTGISTQIIVKVGTTTIGAIQSLAISQDRNIATHEEIGTDGIVDSHPQGASKIGVNVSRIVFDQMRLTEAFSRGYINIQSQRFPFNIEIMDQTEKFLPNGSGNVSNLLGSLPNQSFNNIADKLTQNEMRNLLDKTTIVHILHNCWFRQTSITFTANDFVITESAQITAEYITTHRAGVSAVNGGSRGIKFNYDEIERNTDTYGRAGRFEPVPLSRIYGGSL